MPIPQGCDRDRTILCLRSQREQIRINISSEQNPGEDKIKIAAEPGEIADSRNVELGAQSC